MDQFFWFYVSQKQRIKMISQANLSLWKMGKWKQKNKHIKRWKWLLFIDKWKSPLGGIKGSVCDDALVQGYTK